MAMGSTTKDVGGLFRVFLGLGATSFGGPVAHLALFRKEFVARRGWVTEEAFASLVALCQTLPGPSSSQVALLVGKLRGGWAGAFAAWLGFTLPGALVMGVLGAVQVGAGDHAGWVHGLQVFAVAVVALAAWGMARALAPDAKRRTLSIIAALACWMPGGGAGQLLALGLGAIGGLALGARHGNGEERPVEHVRAGAICLGLFAALLALSLWGIGRGGLAGLAAGAFRSGALVFGGGHVVLPLLRTEVVGPLGMSDARFLAGYGLVQGVPGPLFNISAWIGSTYAGWSGALVAVVAIFLPGALLAVGARPFWLRMEASTRLRNVSKGLNAAVVGILLSALVLHVAPAGIASAADVAICAVALGTLVHGKLPTWGVALACACAGGLLG